MLSHEQALNELKKHLHELFEIPLEDITPEANLFEDLDLDSIDAVDLMIKMQELTGKKISPEKFKTVRTVDDVVVRIVEVSKGE